MSILFMVSLSSVDVYHVRRPCWPCLLVVRREGSLFYVRLLRMDFVSLNRRTRLFNLSFLYVSHGLAWCYLLSFIVCVLWFSADRCLWSYLFPRLGLLGPWSQTFLFCRAGSCPAPLFMCYFSSAEQ